MNSIRLLALSAFAAALALASPARAETWYAQRVTAGDIPVHVEHLWSRDRQLRAESVIGGRPVLTLVSGDFYYIIDRLNARGVAIRRSKDARKADKKGGRPFGHDATRIIAEGGERVRSESLQGRICDIYRVTDDRGRREVWIARGELQLPVRMETFDRASSSRSRSDYLDWTRELTIPDGFFEPDPRIKLERIEYDDYLRRAPDGPIGPAPVFFSSLLHGP